MLCFAQAELIQYAPRYPKQIFHFVLCLLVDSISKMQYVIFNFYQLMFPTPNLLNLHCMYFFFDMLKFNPFYSGASFSPIIFLISSFLVRLISFYIIFKHMHHGISWISAISCTYSWRIIGTKSRHLVQSSFNREFKHPLTQTITLLLPSIQVLYNFEISINKTFLRQINPN